MTAVHVVVGAIRLESCPRHLKTNNSFKSPLKGLLVVVLDQPIKNCLMHEEADDQ